MMSKVDGRRGTCQDLNESLQGLYNCAFADGGYREATSPVTSIFSIFYKMEDCKRRRQCILNENLVTFGYVCPFVFIVYSRVSIKTFHLSFITEFYLPPLFSLPFFRFHTHPVREQNRGNHLSLGVEPKHHFLISNRYLSSPLSVLNSSPTIIISPTQSHFSHFPIYLISCLLYIFSTHFLSPLWILISSSHSCIFTITLLLHPYHHYYHTIPPLFLH